MTRYSTLVYVLLLLTSFQYAIAQSNALVDIALDDASDITVEGAHWFIEIAGIKGLHTSSLKTRAFIETQALHNEKGTISVWFSPLEDIDKAPVPGVALNYPILSNVFPPADIEKATFAVYYKGMHYPRLIAGFTDGSFWGQMDYGVAPFVYADALPLNKGQWYHILVTWDKAAETLEMYVNGELIGHNFQAKAFKEGSNRIYIGNPLMAISRLKISNERTNKEQAKREYVAARPKSNQLADQIVKSIANPSDCPPLNLKLDNSWEKAYECSFTKKSDLEAWTFQTGDLYKDKFKLEISENGLYWETPDIIHTESRGYLWCPYKIEGDQWIEYEFQLVSPKGLSLLILCASGMLGEDIIEDQGLIKTGSMSDMNKNYRNYHWEYVRRVEAMREDVETQYVNKNPWGTSMYVGCIPRLERNKWIKLQCIKIGSRIYGAIDGKTVFEVEDDASTNNGPVLNSGRIVLRQMYHTAMRYRNFKIYQRKSVN